ncbi:hypothetical protein, partial [Leptospira interrogans]|uniref:hypothetical protein n=3 Tax=Leptospira interrogans TaxID=173 RepID=UPI001E4EBE0F
LELNTICCIMFPACNLLTRAESPVRPACGKPDSPRFSYVELKYFGECFSNILPFYSILHGRFVQITD